MITRLSPAWLSIILAGCAGTRQLTSNTESVDFSLGPVSFQQQGIGFLTPISATGQEADRVALALVFADTIADERSV